MPFQLSNEASTVYKHGQTVPPQSMPCYVNDK